MFSNIIQKVNTVGSFTIVFFNYFHAGYINKEWRRESLLIACTPYTKKHSSVNIASWIMVRNKTMNKLLYIFLFFLLTLFTDLYISVALIYLVAVRG